MIPEAVISMRRPVDFDASGLLELALDPAVERWNPVRGVTDLESARTWCRQNADWSVGAHATWVATDTVTGDLIATCALYDIDLKQASAGIGYRVALGSRRRGVARACVDAVTRWGIEEYELARVHLAHDIDNQASCRVATACGFIAEGTLRSSYLDIRGVRHDEHIHGRLATDEWSDLSTGVILQP